MFTGIIRDIGRVALLRKQGDWIITITTQLPLVQTAIGASIACNGVCLTVIDKADGQFKVQVSRETLSKTTALHWHEDMPINLEPALRMGDELGGHLLSGHIDGLVRLVSRTPESDSLRCVFEAAGTFAKFIAPKGSIALDGISLTINGVNDLLFDVNIIPHTQQMTTLGMLTPGSEVNCEVDMIARYVERMIGQRATL